MRSHAHVLVQSIAVPDASHPLLVGYEPEFIRPGLWRDWHDPVLRFAGEVAESHNACLKSQKVIAKSVAGLLSRLLDAVRPDPGTSLADLLTDRNFAVVMSDLQESDCGLAWQKRAWQHLQRARRHALGIQTGTGRRSSRTSPPSRELAALTYLSRLSPLQSSEAAHQLLDALEVVATHPATCPLSQAEMRDLRDAVKTHCSINAELRWADLRRERMWHWLNEEISFVGRLREVSLSHSRLDAIRMFDISHLPAKHLVQRLRGDSGNASALWEVTDHPRSVSSNTKPPSKASSAAEARRLMKEHQRRIANGAQPLTPRLEAILANWKPRRLLPHEWELAKPLTSEIMRLSHIRGVESFQKHLRAVAPFVLWAIGAGHEPRASHLLTSTVIDNYTLLGMKSLPQRARADIRSQLRHIARHAALSADSPLQGPTLHHYSVKPPYTAREVEALRLAIRVCASPTIKAKLQVLVALGIGAGLDQRDLTGMTRNHIIDHGQVGIEVEVPGDRARQVWVRHDWEETLRSGLHNLTSRKYLLGSADPAKDYIGDLYVSQLTCLEGGGHILQSRLRNTWLATLICEPIPLWTILNAAGLASARSLIELSKYVQAVDTASAVRGGQ